MPSGTHLNSPLLGSTHVSSAQKDIANHFEVPLDLLTRAQWNVWEMNPGMVPSGVDTDPTNGSVPWTGLSVSDGSSTNAETNISHAADGSGSLVLAGGAAAPAANDEVCALGPPIFKPAADRPIYMFFDGAVNDITSHFFVGLCSPTTFNSSANCALTAATGALVNFDLIGFHWSLTALILRVQDGTADDTKTFTDVDALILDDTDFRVSMVVRLNSVDYVVQVGTTVVKGRLALATNGPISDLGVMAPNLAIQADAAVDTKMTIHRCWTAQRKVLAANSAFVSNFADGGAGAT